MLHSNGKTHPVRFFFTQSRDGHSLGIIRALLILAHILPLTISTVLSLHHKLLRRLVAQLERVVSTCREDLLELLAELVAAEVDDKFM